MSKYHVLCDDADTIKCPECGVLFAECRVVHDFGNIRCPECGEIIA